MKLLQYTLFSHALYILLTALWPIIDISSFIAVTGPKTDIWLVKTVGALLIPIGLTLLLFIRRPDDVLPPAILGGTTAVSFICIDLYYALTGVISDIYLLDAVAELVFLTGWITILVRRKRQ